MNGILVGTGIFVTGDGSGKEIIETDPPSIVFPGYKPVYEWDEQSEYIVKVWKLIPIEGRAEEASLALSKLQYKSLPDEAAYEFRALADEWISGQSYVGPNDPSGAPQSRVRYQSKLYKCLLTHISQDDWRPGEASSLWAEILPGQSGNEPESGYADWVQPDSSNGYSTGDRVLYDGHLWESIVNDNVDIPGTDNGFRWKDLGEYPA